MFFVDPPVAGHQGFYAQTEVGSMSEAACCDVLSLSRLGPTTTTTSPGPRHDRRDTYLKDSFATTNEHPGRALLDAAAQHVLVGRETLKKMDEHLQQNFGLRVQQSEEDGGAVRGVCGVEEKTPIAYIPVGVAGYRLFLEMCRAWCQRTC